MLHTKRTKKIIQGDPSLTQSTVTLSCFVDKQLQHLVKEIPSYKDTNDFVNKITNFKVHKNF